MSSLEASPQEHSFPSQARDSGVAEGRCCRCCAAPLRNTFVDLGMSPPCENVRRPEEMDTAEVFYPLHVFVCDQCWLVQLREYITPEEIFREYAYFSSMSQSWLEHAAKYAAEMTERFMLGPESQVIEIASNDGYLLQNFVKASIPALGIEPATNVAQVAEAERGVSSVNEFFGVDLAEQLVGRGTQADLLLGNNVLAHVPDINDFVGGLQRLLKPDGVITMEFPHLWELMVNRQFDTIYHEHYSYLSLLAVEKIFGHHGLRLFDVQQLKTHGGSLRIFATHAENRTHSTQSSVADMLNFEREQGLENLAAYQRFDSEIQSLKCDILEFLIQAKRAGKKVAGYGAPGKGVTLLNYCGIRSDLVAFTVDRNNYKQGTYVPGTGIPVFDPSQIAEERPDYVFILPWNLKDEIMSQMSHVREWGGKFVVPIPELEIV